MADQEEKKEEVKQEGEPKAEQPEKKEPAPQKAEEPKEEKKEAPKAEKKETAEKDAAAPEAEKSAPAKAPASEEAAVEKRIKVSKLSLKEVDEEIKKCQETMGGLKSKYARFLLARKKTLTKQ